MRPRNTQGHVGSATIRMATTYSKKGFEVKKLTVRISDGTGREIGRRYDVPEAFDLYRLELGIETAVKAESVIAKTVSRFNKVLDDSNRGH